MSIERKVLVALGRKLGFRSLRTSFYLLVVISFGVVIAGIRTFSGYEARESKVIKSATTYCLPPLYNQKNVADYMLEAGLKEIPADRINGFPGKDVRGFFVPDLKDVFVFSHRGIGEHDQNLQYCSIVSYFTNTKSFWRFLEGYFGAGSSFKKTKDNEYVVKASEGKNFLMKTYAMNIKDGAIALIVKTPKGKFSNKMAHMLIMFRTPELRESDFE